MRLAALLLVVLMAPAWSAQRSAVEKRAFQREHPCPSTGARRGRCPGFVLDHVQPICAGGPDHRSNMAWQSIPDAKRKDVQERRLCRAMKVVGPT